MLKIFNFLNIRRGRGIFEDTNLARLAHLKDTVLIRGTYIIAHIAQSKLLLPERI